MFSEIVYFGTSILGIAAIAYFFVADIFGKKSQPYILANLLFLKKEVSEQKIVYTKRAELTSYKGLIGGQ